MSTTVFTRTRSFITAFHRVSTSTMTMCSFVPHFADGKVVKGFGRGSKELGIPTANFPESVIEHLPEDTPCGVYYGWASVADGEVHKMVMSIGWNPFFKNKKKSMEVHVIHSFNDDFYGSILKIIMLGYVRPMKSFESLDELITAIKTDIATAEEKLNLPENMDYRTNNFFKKHSNSVLSL